MLDALARGMTWPEAARYVGVSSRTLLRWCEGDPGLAEQAAEAKDAADDMVEAVTLANCLDPDPANNTLRIFWLKNRRPAVYQETTKHEVTGAGGGPVAVQFYLPDNGRDADHQAQLPAPGNLPGDPG